MFDYRIFIRWAGECTKMCISRPKKFWEGHYLLRLPLPNGVLPPQYGTHSLLAFALVLHHVLSVVFLKPLFRSGLQFPLAAHTSASDSAFGRHCIHYKALSTLSQKSATVAENGETTATVAEFGDWSCTFLRQCGQAFKDFTYLLTYWWNVVCDQRAVLSCRCRRASWFYVSAPDCSYDVLTRCCHGPRMAPAWSMDSSTTSTPVYWLSDIPVCYAHVPSQQLMLN